MAREQSPVIDRSSTENVKKVGRASEGPSVFLMCAYFLGLASIAVVAVGGHFPWFTLAPLAILLMAAHVRRVEAKFRREAPRHA